MLSSSFSGDRLETGCDEAGRGCLAGPVFAAAVVFSPGYRNDSINDSKKLTRKQRLALRDVICSQSVAWAVAQVSPGVIDEINILNASFLAMEEAVRNLKITPGFLIIDGNRFRSTLGIPFRCCIGGDHRFLSIAAASILAKTFRDDYMESVHPDFPVYNWRQNKGYPTVEHRQAIHIYGLSIHHRKSFHTREQLRMPL
jgi:ribonuclease HII